MGYKVKLAVKQLVEFLRSRDIDHRFTGLEQRR